MHITKYGHCCLLIEVKGKRILTDPGEWSTMQKDVKDLDLILITHEHPDHVHVESLKEVLTNNPNVIIYTNDGVGKILDESGIEYKLLQNGATIDEGLLIESFESPHEEIYEKFGYVQNTGYFIDEKFFYPGDSFAIPGKKVEILAAPIVAPWASFKQCVDYIKNINPEVAIPVHDGMLRDNAPGPTYRLPPLILKDTNIKFQKLEIGERVEF